jgi:DeoR/GlpR family transcriptional regulator of sugar metabolism
MLQAERQTNIFKLIKEKSFLTIKEFEDIFHVSSITIRRDLKELSKQGLIKQVHGGAADITSLSTSFEPLYKTKLYLNFEKKEAIAKKAVEFIDSGETIILDSGTTTLQIAIKLKNKRFKDVGIVTNDIKIADELCTAEHLEVIVLGGILRKFLYTLFGSFTIDFLEQIKVNKFFLAADAISKENGISNANIEEVSIKKLMIQNSQNVILVADSTKFNTDAFCRVCGWEKINSIITDDKISDDYIKFFKEININYQIVSPVNNK